MVVDEGNGRIVIYTAEHGIDVYHYPTLQHTAFRPLLNIKLVGVLPWAVVVTTLWSGSVLLLDPATLATTRRYEGDHKAVAVNRADSAIVLVSKQDEATLVRVNDAAAITEQAVPYPDADGVGALGLLPGGGLLYSLRDKSGLFMLRPPYREREELAGTDAGIASIQVDPAGAIAATAEAGALRTWDLSSRKVISTTWVFETKRAPYRRLQFQKADGNATLAAGHPAPKGAIPYPATYCHARRIFAVNNISLKRGKVVFVSADSSEVLDEISTGGGVRVRMHLSADGTRLITISHMGLQTWHIPPFDD
jgi:hypothetical protein